MATTGRKGGKEEEEKKEGKRQFGLGNMDKEKNQRRGKDVACDEGGSVGTRNMQVATVVGGLSKATCRSS